MEMEPMIGARSDTRLRNLDNRVLVAAVFVIAMGLYLHGALQSEHPYGDPRFVIEYFATELAVAVFLFLSTAAFFPAARIGFRRPQSGKARHWLPLAILLACAIGGWVAARLTLPAGAAIDNGSSLLVLRTTLLVGLTEEWIFRGLLLAALCRWLGARRGAFSALLLFGAFHLLNIAAGAPPLFAALQVVTTILIGSTLLLAAIGTRSLVVPIVVHAIYDFAVIDAGGLAHAGGSSLPTIVTLVAGFCTGSFALVAIARLPQQEPYAP